jgi:hypothetical protein
MHRIHILTCRPHLLPNFKQNKSDRANFADKTNAKRRQKDASANVLLPDYKKPTAGGIKPLPGQKKKVNGGKKNRVAPM